MTDHVLERLQSSLGPKVVAHKDISPYLTLRTQTTAQYYFEAETREHLIKTAQITHELHMKLLILGGGSNIAVTQDELSGLIVRNMYKKKEVIREDVASVDVLVSSGYSIARLVSETIAAGWQGFEYHLGLPGSLGGGLYMNSKWTKPVSYIGDSLIKAYIMDTEGNEKEVDRSYFQFAYDYSILQKTHELVLEAVFHLPKASPDILKQRAQESLKYRHATQPFGVATAGCFFQNVDGKSAGQMIDQAGLKKTKIGSFVVSDKHANFIINEGKAEGDPADLVKLITLVKEKVKEKYGVELKEEVLII